MLSCTSPSAIRNYTGFATCAVGTLENWAEGQSEMRNWKWTQDPKVLIWIIGALVFVIWIVLQKP
jgi:hypothetical protein